MRRKGQNAITARDGGIFRGTAQANKMAMGVPIVVTEEAYEVHPSGMAEIDAKDGQTSIEVLSLKMSSNPLRTEDERVEFGALAKEAIVWLKAARISVAPKD